MDRIQQRLFIIMAAVIIILASILLYGVYFSGDDETEVLRGTDAAGLTEAPESTKTSDATETPAPTEDEEGDTVKTIKVYITGAIMHPGVIELNDGERLADVVSAAGGVTSEADLSKVNLAIKVRDEGMYYIPKPGEDIEMIVEPPQDGADKASDDGENGLININTASQSMLETLPSIGPKRAVAIINYREDKDGFKSNEDIMNVSGIANKIYEGLKDFICVD
ncbi:MAG TPA: helix-hairpin-helix domain-containing protein [Bacillota bacterium]|nr:helix-hairpin-helix domain-containing protein [Bacillota bacterium]